MWRGGKEKFSLELGFACGVNNVNFITWNTCDQVMVKFCFNSFIVYMYLVV